MKTTTDWPKCFCVYRLKCSKANKSTCDANNTYETDVALWCYYKWDGIRAWRMFNYTESKQNFILTSNIANVYDQVSNYLDKTAHFSCIFDQAAYQCA